MVTTLYNNILIDRIYNYYTIQVLEMHCRCRIRCTYVYNINTGSCVCVCVRVQNVGDYAWVSGDGNSAKYRREMALFAVQIRVASTHMAKCIPFTSTNWLRIYSKSSIVGECPIKSTCVEGERSGLSIGSATYSSVGHTIEY